MKKRGHIIFAFIINILFIFVCLYLGFKLLDFNFKSIILVSSIIALYSLLPDIDHKNSTITHWFFGIGILGIIIGIIGLIEKYSYNGLLVIILSAVFLTVVYISSNFIKHRGKIHTLQVGLLAVLPLWLIFHSIGYCLIAYISWHSHLLGDGYLFKIK